MEPLSSAVRDPRIHETAIIDRSARLAKNVEIGPYCIVGADVQLGAGCRLDSHVRLDGPLVAGSNNHFCQGAAIGGAPQDLKYDGAPTGVRIGNDNTFREYATVNRATAAGGDTVIGNRCLIMAYVHVAHDCTIGDSVILANAVNLAGHVDVEHHAIVGGVTAIHQFARVGCYSILGGGSRVPKDMPPYLKAAGNPLRVVGPNVIGLTRNGFSVEARREIKEAFRTLYRSGLNVSQACARILQTNPGPEVQHLLRFIERSHRGIVR